MPVALSPKPVDMGTQMDLANIFAEPILRRCWLLNKALENAPLEEALKLAQAADQFLDLDRQGISQSASIEKSTSGALAAACLQKQNTPLTSVVARPFAENPVTVPAERHADHDRMPEFATNGLEAAESSELKATGSFGDPLDSGSGDNGSDDPPQTGDGNQDIALQPGAVGDLAVLASMDDIVRYLRQRDDVVVSAGADTFLVNGRFRLNSNELLVRANKMRERQGKPLFQWIPLGFLAAGEASFTNGTGK
jgi:hypothetical protein